jgi:hypothetical protein
MKQTMLRPQDVMIALQLTRWEAERWTYASLGQRLCLPASDAHAGMRRLQASGLVLQDENGLRVAKRALRSFLLHGVRYAFPATFGVLTQGVATAGGGPTLSQHLLIQPEAVYVWPSSEGAAYGRSIAPLYPALPKAALLDLALYDWASWIDALRVGSARERELATLEIEQRLL